MVKNKRLIVNTALLTATSLIMSLISMLYQVWLAGRIGATGIGLFSLVLSVGFLCSTFAISGVRFAATRLVSEELGHNRESAVAGAMRRCFVYALFFGVAALLLLRHFAEPIGLLWIGDARTVKPLKIMALSLPLISLSSAMSGYFTACGRVWKPSLVHLSEQLFTIALVVAFLDKSPAGDIEANCTAVVTGTVIGDVISFLLMLIFFVTDRRAVCGSVRKLRLGVRMLRIAVPLAVSAYARSALSTLEHMLIPKGLLKSGCSADRSLAAYGTIHGMVMPVIGFPVCILSALAELIVPELTDSQMKDDGEKIVKTVGSLLKKSLGYSFAVALLLFIFGDALGKSVYSSSEAGYYIRLLSPLVPIMYLDTVVDGCLKGLGQQLWSMGINILDALLGVILVWLLLPKYALTAYIAIIYFNECLNFVLSIRRLFTVVDIKAYRQEQGTAAQR